MNVNLCIVAGRLTRDPELRNTGNGTSVCEFGIAVNEKYKSNEKTHFFDVTAWAQTAEFVNNYFTKGKEIHIVGKLSYESWDDKQAGQKRSKVKIVADRVEFVGGKSKGQQSDQQDDDGCPGSTDVPVTRRQGKAPSQRPTVRAGIASETGVDSGAQPFGDEPRFDPDEVPFRAEGRHQQDI